MAIPGTGVLTLRDINAGRLPNGLLDRQVVQLMAKNNPVLNDVVWQQCNNGNEHVSTIRCGMPDATWRGFYEGVAASKGAKKQVPNTCGTCSTLIQFDKRLYEKSLDKSQFLLDEAEAHADTLGNSVAAALFHGKQDKNPKGINGLARVYGECAKTGLTDTDVSQFYCMNGNSKTVANEMGDDLRSIFLVTWGTKTCHGIYPQGSNAGIQRGKLAFQWGDDGQNANKMMEWGYQDFNWDCGLAVPDFRYCGRIANIDAETITAESGVPDFIELLTRLKRRVKKMGGSKRVLYMPSVILEGIEIQFYRKTSANAISYKDLEQGIDAKIMGLPVAICDALDAAEEAVPVMA